MSVNPVLLSRRHVTGLTVRRVVGRCSLLGISSVEPGPTPAVAPKLVSWKSADGVFHQDEPAGEGAGTAYGQINTRSQYSETTAIVVDDKGNLRVPSDYRTAYQALGSWAVAKDDGRGSKQLHVVYASPGTIGSYPWPPGMRCRTGISRPQHFHQRDK